MTANRIYLVSYSAPPSMVPVSALSEDDAAKVLSIVKGVPE